VLSYKVLPDYLEEKEDEQGRKYYVYSKQFQEGINGVEHNILNDERAPTYINPFDFPGRENCSYNVEGFSCTVPAGQYFMMGDNRDNSLDSRYWGFVPDENIVGKAFFVWMNLSSFPSNLKRIGSFQ